MARANGSKKAPEGLKPKDMVGMPWMLALALRADGWYLRSDIIWSKPNPMPESVKDWPTKAHEYIFLLTKSPQYFYDAVAVIEEAVSSEYDQTRRQPGRLENSRYLLQGRGQAYVSDSLGTARTQRNKRSVWTVTPQQFDEAHFATFPEEL